MKDLMVGLELTLLGMGVVFLTLYALTLLMNLLRFSGDRKAEVPRPAAKPASAPAAAHAPGGTPPEVIAAISAAVAEYLGKPAGSFAVRSVRAEAPAWAAAGRLQQMLSVESLFKRGTRK